MKNFEKSNEISRQHAEYDMEFSKENQIRLQRYNAAMLMAEWKDLQLKNFLVKMYLENKVFLDMGLMTSDNFIIRENTIDCILEEFLQIKDVRSLIK